MELLLVRNKFSFVHSFIVNETKSGQKSTIHRKYNKETNMTGKIGYIYVAIS